MYLIIDQTGLTPKRWIAFNKKAKTESERYKIFYFRESSPKIGDELESINRSSIIMNVRQVVEKNSGKIYYKNN